MAALLLTPADLIPLAIIFTMIGIATFLDG